MYSTNDSSALAKIFLERIVARRRIQHPLSWRSLNAPPRWGFFAVWYASRVAQLAIHKDGLACQSTIVLCSDSPWQSGSDSRDLLRAGLRHGGRSGGGSGGEHFKTTAHMRVQWDRRA